MVIGFMGSRAQTEIVRQLSILGPSAIGKLQAVLSVSRPSLNRHLALLARAGLVETDPPEGMRHGREVVYAVRSARLRELSKEYLSYVEGR